MIEGTGEALKPSRVPGGIEGPQKVLIVCGMDTTSSLHTAELYDPATGTWTPTGSLFSSRSLLSATTLPNRRVLVAGGGSDNVELYNPSVAQWFATGKLHARVANNTTTLLADGRVLVAGGLDVGATTTSAEFFRQSAELYDPNTQVWSFSGDLNIARFNHTATLLPNGKVLVVGGAGLRSPGLTAELYDPATGTWTLTGSLFSERSGHTATLLPNGRVLVAGGGGRRDCELYDSSSGQWFATGKLNEAHGFFTATRLPDGRVLIVGGINQGSILHSAELYDPVSQLWTTTASLDAPLIAHTATLLPDGKVLVSGGSNIENTDGVSSGAKLYNPATESWASTGSLNTPRAFHAAALVEFPPIALPKSTGRPMSILSILDPNYSHLSFTNMR